MPCSPLEPAETVSGASDLTVEERYTGQRRLDAGNGNTRRELYYYGARWYLPGVGVFGQPDVSAIQRRSPQNLNRYAYVLNNPVRHIDPTGQQSEEGEPTEPPTLLEFLITDQPNWFDEGWVQEFQAAHRGETPTAGDYLDRYFGMAVASGMSDEASLTETLQRIVREPSPTDPLSRSPDYIVVTGSFGSAGGPNAQMIVDRYGQVYGSLGGDVGPSPTLVQLSVAGGWVLSEAPPSPEELRQFLTQWSGGVGGGFLLGASIVYSKSGTNPAGKSTHVAVQVGLYSPQVSIGGSYSWFRPRLYGPVWVP